MADVVALIDDLFFQAKVLETAKKAGVSVKMVATADALLAACPPAAGQEAPLIVVDLNARAGGVEAVERLRAAGNRQPIVAFLSHVQVDLAARAQAAGCEVMPRSKFTQDLASILSRGRQP